MEIEETEDIEYLVDSKYDIIKKLESSVKSGDSLINIIPYYKNNNKYVKQIINNFILTRKEKFKEEIKNELCNIKIYKLISLIEVCEEALLMCFEELRKSLWNINELFEKKLNNLFRELLDIQYIDTETIKYICFFIKAGANRKFISQEKLNVWLENFSNNNEILKNLLFLGANKDNALKKAVEKGNIESFKKLRSLGADINSILTDTIWNKILEKQIDDWLEDYSYDAFYYEEVSFLLKEIRRYKEEILKISVEQKHFNSFNLLLKSGADISLIIEDISWNRDKMLEKQIDDWLEDYSYDAFYYEEVSFLLKEIKRYKEEILKISVEQKHYISFGKLLDIGTDLEIVKNDNCWNRDNKYTEQIKLFFEMKNFTCGYTKYANKEGNSTIVAYETGANFVRVYFSSSYIYNTYTYTYKIAGKENIEKMKKLALEGKGLQSYIMKNVRDKYEIRTSTPI